MGKISLEDDVLGAKGRQPTLFYSPHWPLSLGVKGVIEHYQLPVLSRIDPSWEEWVPTTVYGELPILVLGDSPPQLNVDVIEEYRLILLTLHELFPEHLIVSNDVGKRVKLFDELEKIEQGIIGPLFAPIVLDRDLAQVFLATKRSTWTRRFRREYRAVVRATLDDVITPSRTNRPDHQMARDAYERGLHSLEALTATAMEETSRVFLASILSFIAQIPSLAIC